MFYYFFNVFILFHFIFGGRLTSLEWTHLVVGGLHHKTNVMCPVQALDAGVPGLKF